MVLISGQIKNVLMNNKKEQFYNPFSGMATKYSIERDIILCFREEQQNFDMTLFQT